MNSQLSASTPSANQWAYENFKNEPLTDFSIASNRAAWGEAVQEFKAQIKKSALQASPIISGVDVSTDRHFTRVNPNDTSCTLGSTCLASTDECLKAIESVCKGADTWSKQPPNERAKVLENAAHGIRQNRLSFAALIMHEAGKPWLDTDAEIAEAIDFCNFYACEMRRLGGRSRTAPVLGELNTIHYEPRGTVAVISPWNFPLAITCGMAVAALVAGNGVLLKPSTNTSHIAYKLVKVLLEAGLPKEVIAFLPGPGSQVGNALVKDPRVNMVCFTGSKEVGLDIIRHCSSVVETQRFVKNVVAEMGGKNAIIIDDDADLDDAVKGVTTSAFGYAGQKCSACSRVIVVGDAYKRFIERLAAATRDRIIGDSSDPATAIGPVIDQASQARIENVIATGDRYGTLLYRGELYRGELYRGELYRGEIAHEAGFFVSPAIFTDVAPSSPLWQEEIFGPVLAIRSAKNFDEALTLANDCNYALTGGVFSRSPEHIERACREFHVGNLYINRGITGSVVQRQPFGGFKLSGVGSKAGGTDYLLQFMLPRVITENMVRKGFSPDLLS